MKLFKVTYRKISHPSNGLHWEEHQSYYTCNSLDRLYNYIENEEHLTILAIEILKCTVIENKLPPDINKQQFKSLSLEGETTIIKAM